MARQLKRWESPRSEGRNHKGKGGSARQRQRKKQFQRLRATLRQGVNNTININMNNSGKRDDSLPAALLWALLKSGMIGSKAPNHPALFSSQESATPFGGMGSF